MSIQMILRADDIGYSEAVNYGIEKTVKEGLVRTAGLMVNMPATVHGLKLVEGTGICLGQHTNLCIGKPCADPAKIPSLLDENGNLKSSKIYRAAFAEGREFTVLDEMVIEIEAQYHRFKELVGRDPDYFEAHAVQSKNLSKALAIVAEKYGLKLNTRDGVTGKRTFCGKPIASQPIESMQPDYDPWESLKKAVRLADPSLPNVFVCHPGYLDDFILRSSSLTVNRTKEVAMLTDPAMKDWLDAHDVQLITYSDLV